MPIKAKTITAKNVIEGLQAQGVGADDAASLAAAAAKIIGSGGGIEADEIHADNVVEGLQLLANPAAATVQTLRSDLTVIEGELADAPEPARQALAQVKAEVGKDTPDKKSLLEKLETLSSTLKNASEFGEKAVKLAKLVPWITAAVAAAKLWLGVP